MRADDKRTQRGVALVLVLWGIMAVTLMALSFSRATRSETRLAAAATQGAQARATAQAGIWIGLRALLDQTAHAPQTLGAPMTLPFADGTVTLRFQDQEGLVDLNVANADLLRAAFAAADADPARADDLASILIDWRDPAPGSVGASYQNRPTAGSSSGAKHAPFNTVDELRDLPSMTQSLFARVAPLVTVHSGRIGIDPKLAPEALRPHVADPRLHVQSTGRVYAIRCEGRFGAARRQIEAIVRLGGPAQKPYSVIAWREVVARGA